MGTLIWVSERFGALNPESIERLTRKKESVMDTLVKAITAPQRQAVVPSVSVLIAMEQGLMDDQFPMANRYILGVARFMAGCSARFNDIQHCRPEDYRLTSNSLEVMAWQTKTSGAQSRYRRSCVLIAPLWSFTGHRWWEMLLSLFQRIASHEKLKIMDFSIPTISRNWKGLIPRPCSYNRALRWLKEALYPLCPSGDISRLTWRSMRVFMPDCAFQANIPKELRQYLGNWTSSTTADVYTRDKRNVLRKLWLDVCSKIATLNTDGSRLARVDLNHEDYDKKETEVSTPASKRSRASSNESWQKLDQTPRTPTGTVGSEEEGEVPPADSFGPEEPRDRTQQQPTPFDKVDNILGPQTVVCRVSGPKTCQKIMHL